MPTEETTPAPSAHAGNVRRCRQCEDAIIPFDGDVRFLEAYCGHELGVDLAAMLHGYCSSDCMALHAFELVEAGAAWWQR